MVKIFSKKNILLVSIIVVSLIVTIVSVSYAYFTASVSGNSNASNTVITTGTMQLSFSDGPLIEVSNLLPGSSVVKEFSVTNTGNLKSEYDVYFSELLNMFSNKDELVYIINSSNGCSNLNQREVPDNSGEKMVSGCLINPGQTHNYTLNITFKETDEIQDGNKGKFVDFKISVNEYRDLFVANLIEDGQQINNVSSMKSSNLSVGNRVKTLGYYTSGDGGEASYVIEEKTTQVIDGGKYIELDNGNVARLLYDNVISVKQYGAKGDNSTDDGAALASIFSKLGEGETVFVPRGSYIVSEPLKVFDKNNIKIIGEGSESVFVAKEGFGQDAEKVLLYFYGTHNAIVSKLAISGNLPVNDYHGIRLFDMWASGNVIVDQVSLINNRDEAIRLVSGVENISVANSNFNTTDCGIIAMGTGNIDGLIVENNTFDGHQSSEPVSLFGVAEYSNIYINNNRILNKTNGQSLYLGNYVDSNGDETRGQSVLTNITVTNNYIRNSGGMTIRHANNLLIKNNNFYNDEPLSIAGGSGINLLESSDVVITGNIIDRVKMYGMKLVDLSNVKIYGNTIKDSGYLNDNYFFVTFSGQSSNIEFYNNDVIREDDSLYPHLIVVHGNGGIKLYDNNVVNGKLRLWTDASNIYVSNSGQVLDQGTNNIIVS